MPDETVIPRLGFNDIPIELNRKFTATCALTTNKDTGKSYTRREAIIELMELFVIKEGEL